jgi:hypothetical protein
MISQELEDGRLPLDNTYGTKRIPEDDLAIGQFVCVYNLKKTDECAPIIGQSLEVKAVCLPFFVGKLLSDPSEPTLTLDCRYLNLMRVTKEFVDAQREGVKGQEMMPEPRRKRKQE